MVGSIFAVLRQQRYVTERMAAVIDRHDRKANNQHDVYKRNRKFDPDISIITSCYKVIDMRITGFKSIESYARQLADEVSLQV